MRPAMRRCASAASASGSTAPMARPDLDAELLGHLLLGSLHSDLVLHLLRRGETERLTATLHELITTLLPA
jgi:hypothetical protein